MYSKPLLWSEDRKVECRLVAYVKRSLGNVDLKGKKIIYQRK